MSSSSSSDYEYYDAELPAVKNEANNIKRDETMFPPWSNIDVIEKSFEKSLGSFERDDIIDMEKRREKLSAMRRQLSEEKALLTPKESRRRSSTQRVKRRGAGGGGGTLASSSSRNATPNVSSSSVSTDSRPGAGNHGLSGFNGAAASRTKSLPYNLPSKIPTTPVSVSTNPSSSVLLTNDAEPPPVVPPRKRRKSNVPKILDKQDYLSRREKLYNSMSLPAHNVHLHPSDIDALLLSKGAEEGGDGGVIVVDSEQVPGAGGKPPTMDVEALLRMPIENLSLKDGTLSSLSSLVSVVSPLNSTESYCYLRGGDVVDFGGGGGSSTSGHRMASLNSMHDVPSISRSLRADLQVSSSSGGSSAASSLHRLTQQLKRQVLQTSMPSIPDALTSSLTYADATCSNCAALDNSRRHSIAASPMGLLNDYDKRGSVIMQRPRTTSGSRFLSDQEIMKMMGIVNLQTGEQMPMNLTASIDSLDDCTDPITLSVLNRAKRNKSIKMQRSISPDNISTTTSRSSYLSRATAAKHRGAQKFKQMFGKTVKKMKHVKKDVFYSNGIEELDSDSDNNKDMEGRRQIKIKSSNANKGPYDFDFLVPTQDLIGHEGPIWCMKFSDCGRLLATGSHDHTIRVWILKSAYPYFNELKDKYTKSNQSPTHMPAPPPSRCSPSTSPDTSDNDEHTSASLLTTNTTTTTHTDNSIDQEYIVKPQESTSSVHAAFRSEPFLILKGHLGPVLDISWSKNHFMLSSSMDKIVRIWHVTRSECLLQFKHNECVSGIEFLPKDDRYFISGCMDGKIRLWSIPDKKVMVWNEVAGGQLVTALGFCLKYVVVGTYEGMCLFYSTESLKYFTQINVRSTRGRNAQGHKITSLVTSPNQRFLLVTSNDSRIRMYDVRDLSLVCKFKGHVNISSQIKASFSSTGKYITCGSEDTFTYIWKTEHAVNGQRRDRNSYWESIKAHDEIVTVAIFAPVPELIIRSQFDLDNISGANNLMDCTGGEVLISADHKGIIKVFINKFKPETE